MKEVAETVDRISSSVQAGKLELKRRKKALEKKALD